MEEEDLQKSFRRKIWEITFFHHAPEVHDENMEL